MRASEQRRPRLRRLGDQLGACYTPLAVAIALVAWVVSGDAVRFLAVLVVATPCPLLIAIPVAIIGSISLAARRGIIIKDPAVLEKIDTCRTAIFDKTGTLTYGQPQSDRGDSRRRLRGRRSARAWSPAWNATRSTRWPAAILDAAQRGRTCLCWTPAQSASARRGAARRSRRPARVEVTQPQEACCADARSWSRLPAAGGGLECVVLDRRPLCRDLPLPRRAAGRRGVVHPAPEAEAPASTACCWSPATANRRCATWPSRSASTRSTPAKAPEQKLAIVREETAAGEHVFLGDGINDAPALTAATVGIAFGQDSDITAEAAGAVIMDSSLQKVDELLHIGRRMRSIALQSAVGGMALSIVGDGARRGGLPAAGRRRDRARGHRRACRGQRPAVACRRGRSPTIERRCGWLFLSRPLHRGSRGSASRLAMVSPAQRCHSAKLQRLR